MAWSRLEDDLDENAKILSFSHRAFRLYVCSITFASRNRTRGVLTTTQALALARAQGGSGRTVAELVSKRGWDTVDGGYAVHDYTLYHPADNSSTERVRRYRDRLRQRDAKRLRNDEVTRYVTPTETAGNCSARGTPNTRIPDTPSMSPPRNAPPENPNAERAEKETAEWTQPSYHRTT